MGGSLRPPSFRDEREVVRLCCEIRNDVFDACTCV